MKVIAWLLGALGLVIVVLACMASANGSEPLLLRKDTVVARLEAKCPHLPWSTAHGEFVVKPTNGTCMGRGVDKESSTWTQAVCERDFGVPCMRQAYHPGPWEVRLVRNGSHWDASVAWVVPSEHAEPAALRVTFPWQAELQECVQRVLPDMPFSALDVRTTGFDIRVLEVNGSFGIPFQWTVGDVSIATDMLRWMASRVWEGLQHPSRWAPRFGAFLANQMFKAKVRQKHSRFWF